MLKFSIVVPSYARPEQLRTCIGALTALEYPRDRFEVIVVDDGSPTSPEPILEPFQEDLSIRLVQQPNSGPATARNTGARNARGELIAFTDDDCMPRPDWLSSLEAAAERHPGSCLGGRIHNALPNRRGSTASQLLLDYIYGYFNKDEATFFASMNMCAPAEAFLELGGFDQSFPFAAGEDRDFCSRWRHDGKKLVYAPEAVIDHAHALGPRSFWRQHFGYGRGAHHFHSKEAERGARGIKVEPLRFYTALLCYPFGKLGFLRAATISVWLFVSQVANAAGFFYERSRSRRDA